MLAMADKHGRVWGSIPGLANRARIDVEACRGAIASFLSPDADSRTKEYEGRRIEEIDGGWRLLNHAKYRAIQDEENVRESKRKWWHENRGKLDNPRKTRSHSIQAEADTEADTKEKKKGKTGSVTSPDTTPVVAKLPLRGGLEFEVRESLVVEFTSIYPAVDVPRTLQEMRGWCLGNPGRLKTVHGVRRFINNWLREEQEKYGGQTPT
jgi:hypothetical protein